MAVQNHDVGCGLGTVKLTIQVGDPQGLQFEELDVIAGTRSTYTAVPRATLERLGVPVERTPPFRDRRRPHNPRRRRTDHHQAAGAGVPHPGHIRRTRRAQPIGHGHPRRGRPHPGPGGRTSHTQNTATYLTKNTVGPTSASNDGFSLHSLDRHHSAVLTLPAFRWRRASKALDGRTNMTALVIEALENYRRERE